VREASGITAEEDLMHLFDAEASLIEDLKGEGELVAERQGEDFSVCVLRHPTLGKLVLVAGPSGAGVVVEADE